MHILHICNDFLGTSVHESLYRELDNLGITQTVFVPKKAFIKKAKKSILFKTIGSSIVYSTGLRKYHKYFYGLKVKTLVKDIQKKINLSEIDIIHAPVLSNEGAVAYEIHLIYNIPYITTVRNADLNDYFRVFLWRRPYFRKIALNSERVVFISSRYPERFKKSLRLVDGAIDSKLCTIHNGVSDVFLKNRYFHNDMIGKPIKVVMTGAFICNKNIEGLFSAVQRLRVEGYEIELSAIGNNLSTNPLEIQYAIKLIDLANNHPWFTVFEAQPREELILSLRNYDIFALVSHHETFGLSYIEALSQGLPVVYTKGEGFDGTYDEGYVGYGAFSDQTESISEAIKKVIVKYSVLMDNIKKLEFNEYSWKEIAKRYYVIYNDIIKN